MKNLIQTSIYWNVAFILIAMIFINHFLVMVSFLSSFAFMPFVFPLSLITAVLASFYAFKTNKSEKLWSVAISFIVVAFSIVFSTFYYDFTFDGQWYHQAAIFKIEEGWNPLFNPLDNAHQSILHFPKGTWYFSAAAFSFTPIFEAAKCLNILMIAIAALLVYTTSIDYGLSKIKSIALAVLVNINPVVWSELTTFQNDNNLYLNLVIYIVATFAWYQNYNKTYRKTILLIGAMACINLINIKFTGLLFFVVFAAFIFMYFVLFKREYLLKFIVAHAIIIVLGVFVFGFNPYVTNFIHRGNSLYPIFGSTEFPGHLASGRDGNERYETPKNMVGKTIYERFFYANFSKPSNAPYNNQQDAELIFPFTSKTSDWKVYRFHDLRVSAFGPYFSGVLVLAIGYFIFLFIVSARYRWIMLYAVVAIIASLMLSKHFWWARFGPQLWLFPIILVFITFLRTSSKSVSIFNWTLVSLIVVNGLIVLTIHLRWVHQSTTKLQQQLSEIQQLGKPIEICMMWFDNSMNHKLDDLDISYTPIARRDFRTRDKEGFKELRTVVDGYPGTMWYRVMDENVVQSK